QIKEETSSLIKLEDLAKLVSHVQPTFKDIDLPKDDPVIVVDDTDEDEEDEIHAATNDETGDTLVPKSSSQSSQIQKLTNKVLILQCQKHKLELEKNKAEVALLRAQPSFPNMEQLNELLVKSLKTEFSNILSAHDFRSSLPTELKDLPSKFNELTKEVKRLKKQVHELEIKLPGDLKEIPTKLKDFTKTVASVQAKLKTLDALPGLLLNVTQALNKFAQEKKSKEFDFITKDGMHIHLTEEDINHQKKLEEDSKAEVAKQEGEIRKVELVDLLGSKVVKKYYNDKLQCDKYYDKMLNIRAVSRITNCDVLTRKGPITLKVYREDGTSEIIPNFKANDLHLGEWREVMKACPNKIRKGWETIYKQIGTRMDYIYTTEAELGINLGIPLSKQDSFDTLNDLANKKR
nr:hypothetical protein [Tanacetum cinerariifolium]